MFSLNKNNEMTPVDWQAEAKAYCLAEFQSENLWDSLEFAARCESFMPARCRRDPANWLQWIHPSFPHGSVAQK